MCIVRGQNGGEGSLLVGTTVREDLNVNSENADLASVRGNFLSVQEYYTGTCT
jgi:hypothetical protein